MPWIGKAMVPVSWEGYAVTVAFVLGLGLLKLVDDLNRRAIAVALLVAAYGVIAFLTWDDPDAEVRLSWRERLWNRQTLVWLAVWLVFGAVCVFAGYQSCLGCLHRPAPLR